MKSVGAVLQVDVGRVRPFAGQPRTEFEIQEQEELDGSMHEFGQVQPILVRRVTDDPDIDFEIVEGERRWRSCQKRGQRTIDVFVIRVTDEDDQFIKSLVAGSVRAKLTHRDTARAVGRVWRMDRFAKMSDHERQHQVGKVFGRSSTWVEQYVRMGELAPEVQDLVDSPTAKYLPVRAASQLHALPRERQVAIGRSVASSGLRANDKVASATERARREGAVEPVAPGKAAFERAVDFCRDVARVSEMAEGLVQTNPRLIVNAMLAEPRTKLGILQRLDKAIETLTELRDTLRKVGT